MLLRFCALGSAVEFGGKGKCVSVQVQTQFKTGPPVQLLYGNLRYVNMTHNQTQSNLTQPPPLIKKACSRLRTQRPSQWCNDLTFVRARLYSVSSSNLHGLGERCNHFLKDLRNNETDSKRETLRAQYESLRDKVDALACEIYNNLREDRKEVLSKDGDLIFPGLARYSGSLILLLIDVDPVDIHVAYYTLWASTRHFHEIFHQSMEC